MQTRFFQKMANRTVYVHNAYSILQNKSYILSQKPIATRYNTHYKKVNFLCCLLALQQDVFRLLLNLNCSPQVGDSIRVS